MKIDASAPANRIPPYFRHWPRGASRIITAATQRHKLTGNNQEALVNIFGATQCTNINWTPLFIDTNRQTRRVISLSGVESGFFGLYSFFFFGTRGEVAWHRFSDARCADTLFSFKFTCVLYRIYVYTYECQRINWYRIMYLAENNKR